MLEAAPPLPLRLTATYCGQLEQRGNEMSFYSTTFTTFSVSPVDEQLVQPSPRTQQQAGSEASAPRLDAERRAASSQQQPAWHAVSQPASQATLAYGTHPCTQPMSQQDAGTRQANAGVLPRSADYRALTPPAVTAARGPASSQQQARSVAAPAASNGSRPAAAQRDKERAQVGSCVGIMLVPFVA